MRVKTRLPHRFCCWLVLVSFSLSLGVADCFAYSVRGLPVYFAAQEEDSRSSNSEEESVKEDESLVSHRVSRKKLLTPARPFTDPAGGLLPLPVSVANPPYSLQFSANCARGLTINPALRC